MSEAPPCYQGFETFSATLEMAGKKSPPKKSLSRSAAKNRASPTSGKHSFAFGRSAVADAIWCEHLLTSKRRSSTTTLLRLGNCSDPFAGFSRRAESRVADVSLFPQWQRSALFFSSSVDLILRSPDDCSAGEYHPPLETSR